MDAPAYELLIRLALAVLATIAGTALAIGWRRARSYPASPLLAYLAGVVIVNAAWRWYILWLGLQHDVDGSWAIDSEPVIRSIGSALLGLLYLALALIAVFHARRLRR